MPHTPLDLLDPAGQPLQGQPLALDAPPQQQIGSPLDVLPEERASGFRNFVERIGLTGPSLLDSLSRSFGQSTREIEDRRRIKRRQQIEDQIFEKNAQDFLANRRQGAIIEDVGGFKRFSISGERAFPGVQAPAAKPLSTLGKIEEDIRNKIITRAEVNAAGGGSAFAEKVAALEKTGIDHETAVGIQAGRFRITRDPQTGVAQVVDLGGNNIPFADPQGDMTRVDGTQKGQGFLGELRRPGGGVSTELSIGVNIDGEEVLIPSLVPTLTKDEVNFLLTNEGIPPKNIINKATAFARQRKSRGLPFFKQPGESPTRNGPGRVPDVSQALGVGGVARTAVNKIADLFGGELPFQEASEAAAQLSNLNNEAIQLLRTGLDGKLNVQLQQRIERLLVEPNQIFGGEQEAKSKFTAIIDTIDTETQRLESQIQRGGLRPETLDEARQKISELRTLSGKFKSVLASQDPQDKGDIRRFFR